MVIRLGNIELSLLPQVCCLIASVFVVSQFLTNLFAHYIIAITFFREDACTATLDM